MKTCPTILFGTIRRSSRPENCHLARGDELIDSGTLRKICGRTLAPITMHSKESLYNSSRAIDWLQVESQCDGKQPTYWALKDAIDNRLSLICIFEWWPAGDWPLAHLNARLFWKISMSFDVDPRISIDLHLINYAKRRKIDVN